MFGLYDDFFKNYQLKPNANFKLFPELNDNFTSFF